MARSGPAGARVVLAACVVAFLAACDGNGGSAVVATTGASTPPSPPSAAARCPAPALDPVDAASVLVPGPTNGLPHSEAGGDKLVIAAAVLDPACEPARGAKVTMWHTDARGHYGPSGTDACCYYWGTVHSDDNGRIRLESIRPGQYPEPGAPPAHIHVDIDHPSGRLATEIVFTAGPDTGVIPVVLQSISPQHGDRYWYGEATLVLAR